MKFGFLLFGALWFSASFASAQDTYRTYRNPRFGTTVTYPANLVAPQPESTNGDGRKFLSRDGQIELTTYAFFNTSRRQARGEMNRAVTDWRRDGARLTYARYGSSWFVLSGYLGADIFYEKTLLRDGVFHTLIWQYPQSLKKRLDPSVTRSTTSFAVGRGFERPVSAPRVRIRPTPTPRPRRAPRVPTIGY